MPYLLHTVMSHETDAHHPPPPPYHQVHSSPSLDAVASHQPSPPSYSHSSPSPLTSLFAYLSPPPSPSHPTQSADSLLPFVHLSLGLLSGYSCGYSVRHLIRPLCASLSMSATLLSIAHQQGWVDVRWSRVQADVEAWVELYSTRGDALYRTLQHHIQHSEHDPNCHEDDDQPAAAEWDEKVVRAIEALAVRLLTTASGVGFTLGLAYALMRRR